MILILGLLGVQLQLVIYVLVKDKIDKKEKEKKSKVPLGSAREQYATSAK